MKELAAAIIFFTRLPLWKICRIDNTAAFKNVVPYWSYVGWLTGGIMAITFIVASMFFPTSISIILSILSRILLTGGLHEDGLADFCDGFGGGGNNRQRILSIMKDSHIGTYGVIGLIMYFLLIFNALLEMPAWLVPHIMFGSDAWSKFCSAQIINFLPYARKEEEAKNKTVYSRMNFKLFCISLIGGCLPLFAIPIELIPALLFPAITATALIITMRRKIGGYTGDCCGATFLISELSFYVGILIILQFIPVI